MRDLRSKFPALLRDDAFLRPSVKILSMQMTQTSLALILNVWSRFWKYVQTTFLSGTCKSIETRSSALGFTWLLKALLIMAMKSGGRQRP